MKDPNNPESAASAETLPVPATRAQVPARVEAGEPAATTGPEWLGTTEAARRLGITTRTLYRFIDQGKLAAYRFGPGHTAEARATSTPTSSRAGSPPAPSPTSTRTDPIGRPPASRVGRRAPGGADQRLIS